jgi:hypothetical protein
VRKIFSFRISDLLKLTFQGLYSKKWIIRFRIETMVKFRQSCCGSEAPRPEQIKSWMSTICYDIIKLWLEHQKKEDLTSWSVSARIITYSQRIIIFYFFYFLLDQKVAKSQGFTKMAENRRAFWLEETKVVTFSPYWIPMYKNLPCIASHHRRRFFSIFPQ